MTTRFALERRLFWQIAVAAAVIVGGVLSVIYTISLFGACSSTVFSTIPSPDGKKSIVIFRKKCNATVPYSTQASIAPAGLASPEDKIPAFFIISGTPAITAGWHGNNAVEMTVVAPAEKIFRKQQTVGDIEIAYK
jgi:hypothetical protein